MLTVLSGRLARRCGPVCRQQVLLFGGESLEHCDIPANDVREVLTGQVVIQRLTLQLNNSAEANTTLRFAGMRSAQFSMHRLVRSHFPLLLLLYAGRQKNKVVRPKIPRTPILKC